MTQFAPGCTCCGGCRCRTWATHRKWNLLLEKQWDRNLDPGTNKGEAPGIWPLGDVNACAFDPDGNLYVVGKTINGVSAQGQIGVAKFDAAGRCVREIAIHGSDLFPKTGFTIDVRSGAVAIVSSEHALSGGLTTLHLYDLALDHLWSKVASPDIPGVFTSAPAVFSDACLGADGRVFVAGGSFLTSSGKNLAAYDAAGTKLWNFEGPDTNYVSIRADETRVYAGSLYNSLGGHGNLGVQILDFDGADVDYLVTGVENHIGLAVRGGVLVVVDGDAETCNVKAYDTSDLSPLWTRSRPGPRGVAIGADGLIYTVGDHPALVIFDAAGNQVSCHQHTTGRWAAGVAVNDVALITAGEWFNCDEGGGASCTDASCSTTTTTTTEE